MLKQNLLSSKIKIELLPAVNEGVVDLKHKSEKNSVYQNQHYLP